MATSHPTCTRHVGRVVVTGGQGPYAGVGEFSLAPLGDRVVMSPGLAAWMVVILANLGALVYQIHNKMPKTLTGTQCAPT